MNHIQLKVWANILWFYFNKCFTKTCMKIQFVHIFKNKIPNGVRPIALESPWKYLSVAFDLASKLLIFLNGIKIGKTSVGILGNFKSYLKINFDAKPFWNGFNMLITISL